MRDTPLYISTMSSLRGLLAELALLKWRVLGVACFMCAGLYYTMDFPGSFGMGPRGSIEAYFLSRGEAYTEEMNQSLYSVYAWPNTVLAFVGGLLIDKYLGLRVATLLFCSLAFLGSVLFWIGVATASFPLMITSRVVFGLGGESLSVAMNALVARWFGGGRVLALALGITITVSRAWNSANYLVSPRLCASHGVPSAALAGVGVSALSMLACTALFALDRYGESRGDVARQTADGNASLNLRHILTAPRQFFLLCAAGVLVYCVETPFTAVARTYYQVKFDQDETTAASYVALHQMTGAIASPLVGLLVDVTGRLAQWLLAAATAFLGIHVLLLATYTPPYVVMPLMGVAYAMLVASFWPAVPFILPVNMVGIGYGFMMAAQNLGLAVVPLIVGTILDRYTPSPPGTPWTSPAAANHVTGNSSTTAVVCGVPCGVNVTTTTAVPPGVFAPLPGLNGFRAASAMFIGGSVVAMALAALLWWLDGRRTGGVLSASPAQRTALLHRVVASRSEKAAVVATDDMASDGRVDTDSSVPCDSLEEEMLSRHAVDS